MNLRASEAAHMNRNLGAALRETCLCQFSGVHEPSCKAHVNQLRETFAKMFPPRKAATSGSRKRERTPQHKALVASQSAKRRASKMLRTPRWADLEAIRSMYDEAERLSAATGVKHHVDHVIPLQGRLVSGLHVHTNMRVVTLRENLKKHNKYEP